MSIPERNMSVQSDSVQENLLSPSRGQQIESFPNDRESYDRWKKLLSKDDERSDIGGDRSRGTGSVGTGSVGTGFKDSLGDSLTSTSAKLPNLEITFGAQTNDNSTSSELGAISSRSDLNQADQARLTELQGKEQQIKEGATDLIQEEREKDLRETHAHHRSEDYHEIDEVAVGEKNKFADTVDYSANRSAEKQKKNLLASEFGDRFDEAALQTGTSSAPLELEIQALNHHVFSEFQDQGSDKPPSFVSLQQLNIEKRDGRVLLTAPDGVALLKPDGAPLSAMELGAYVRSDGTVLIGGRGNTFGPKADIDEVTQQAVLDKALAASLAQATNGTDLLGAIGNDSTSSVNNSNYPATEQISEAEEAKPAVIDAALVTSDQLLDSISILNQETNMQGKESEILKVADKGDGAGEGSDKTTERLYRSRLGETLRSIALSQLNDVALWPLLAQKNDLPKDRDLRSAPIEKGTNLLIPTASEIENYQAIAQSLNMQARAIAEPAIT